MRSRDENSQQYQLEKLLFKPNPAFEKLELENALIGSEYTIIDLSGKRLKSDIIENAEISIEGFSSGMYVLYITSNSDKVIRYGKFFKAY